MMSVLGDVDSPDGDDGHDIAATLTRWASMGLVPPDVEVLLSEAAEEIVRLRDGWGVWHAEYMEADADANLWKTLADHLYFSSRFLVANRRTVDNGGDTSPVMWMILEDALSAYELVADYKESE